MVARVFAFADENFVLLLFMPVENGPAEGTLLLMLMVARI
jgi:hypothetical protein